MKKNLHLTLTFIVGAVLRFYRLDFQSFWLDEGFTAFIISGSLKDTLNLCIANKHLPPLYFFLLNIYSSILGNTEFILRSFSVIFGILSIPLIYKLGKELFNREIGIFSSFLLAINPFHIYYSQEARPYALAIFLCLCSIYFFIKILKEENYLSWLLFTLFTILSIYTHYFCLYILPAGFIFLMFKNRKLILKYLISNLVVLLLFIPWMKLLFVTFSDISRISIQKPFIYGLIELPKIFFVFSVGHSAMETTSFDMILQDIFSNSFVILPTIIGGGIFVVSSLIKKTEIPFFACFLFFPIVLNFFAEMYLKSGIMNPRYLLMFSPIYILMLGSGMYKLKRKLFLTGLFALLLPMVFSIRNHFFIPKFQKQDWRGLCNYIEKNETENELLFILFPTSTGSPVDYYYQGKNELIYLSNIMNLDITKEEKINEFLKDITTGKNGCWLPYLGWKNWDKREVVKNWLDENSKDVSYKKFNKIPLYHYRWNSQ